MSVQGWYYMKYAGNQQYFATNYRSCADLAIEVIINVILSTMMRKMYKLKMYKPKVSKLFLGEMP